METDLRLGRSKLEGRRELWVGDTYLELMSTYMN
jgi:hypothetical protein